MPAAASCAGGARLGVVGSEMLLAAAYTSPSCADRKWDFVVRPLIATKLFAPKVRRGLVARPRLLERLDRGGESRLTLVSAPAGFGKTTLLADWLARTAN